MTPAERDEAILFVVAGLFRLECATSKVVHQIIRMREKDTPGGLNTLIHDPDEIRGSIVARQSTCHLYEELLESVNSPALRDVLELYQKEWCNDLDLLEAVKKRSGGRLR